MPTAKQLDQNESVIRLSSNENPLGCSQKAREALESQLDLVDCYPSRTSDDLRASLADFYDISPEKVFTGNGSDEIIGLLVQNTSAEKEIIYPHPSFIKYRFNIKNRGRIGKKVPLTDNYRVDLQAIEAEINEDTGLIFICDPNNPTGTIQKEKRLRDFLKAVPEKVTVVLDQAYYEYVTREDYFRGHDELGNYPNLIILRTFSKAYGLAGVRAGYALGNPDLIEELDKIRDTFNLNRFAQAAAQAALEDQEHINKSREFNLREKDYLCRNLEEMGLTCVPSQANFIFVKTPQKGEKIASELEKRDILVKAGAVIGDDHAIRITVSSREQNDKFLRELQDII
ncbi:histidinol-phosphate transaminase [Halarsenatibacter silvermanii]|uniref:Histidinol-phosphate aminotransferase n=1 Tax=Halarsenatibacter silvermanii TaxID=321763 RepID=A0A1G9QVY5_9FIRM|nr:histidinol-phosphate transaminase [Halarsenatibacter silvermanii]SDM14415.1 histidinol phosphate aminotransferase apoenzyme [Halarsenatibacter silvermanii]